MAAPKEKEFSIFENKVDEVMQILNSMSSSDQDLSEKATEPNNKFLGTEEKKYLCFERVDQDSFLVKTSFDRTVVNKNESLSLDPKDFMVSIEKDANRRAVERKHRELIAQDLRKMGNQAFRNQEFEKAISMYSKAIDQVRDSPILYSNRALSFIRVSLYKRAVIDCDFVLNKLDEKNLRAWLYRAKAYFLLNEKRLYEKSICEAKKHHPKDIPYIEKIIIEIEGSPQNEAGQSGNDYDDEDECIESISLTK